MSFDQILVDGLSQASKAKPVNSADNSIRRLKEAASSPNSPLDPVSVDRLTRYFSSIRRMAEIGETLPFPVEDFMQLAIKGLSKSFELGIQVSPDSFREVQGTVILNYFPSHKALETLAKHRSSLRRELLEILYTDPEKLIDSPPVGWTLRRATSAELQQLLNKSLGGNLAIPRILAQHLLMDNTGVGLKSITKLLSDGRVQADLIGALFTNPGFTKAFLKLGPKLLSKYDEEYLRILNLLLTHQANMGARAAREFSISLAEFGLSLVKQSKRFPWIDSALRIAAEWARKRSEIAPNDQVFVLTEQKNLRNDVENVRISLDSARLVVESMEKLSDHRLLPVDVIASLALNLGLTRIGKAGVEVMFDPGLHVDSKGGLLRGQNAVIKDPGWSIDDFVLRKPTVASQNA